MQLSLSEEHADADRSISGRPIQHRRSDQTRGIHGRNSNLVECVIDNWVSHRSQGIPHRITRESTRASGPVASPLLPYSSYGSADGGQLGHNQASYDLHKRASKGSYPNVSRPYSSLSLALVRSGTRVSMPQNVCLESHELGVWASRNDKESLAVLTSGSP